MIGLGLAAHGLGDYERAAAAYTEAAELARAGGYTWFLAVATDNLGDLLVEQGDYAQARPHLEEAHELFRELGDERMVGVVVVNLGTLAAREGRSDEAEALLHQALEYAEAQVDKELAIWCLSELPALTLSNGDAERAARLTGAMETLREETGHAPSPDQQRLSEQTRSALVSELGEERLAVALAVGREMTFEQAMAYALQNSGALEEATGGVGVPNPGVVGGRGGRPGPELGGAQPRALLALLLLHANEAVARDRLIEELWDGRPPETAATAVQVHVSQLRKVLGQRRDRHPQRPGYLIRAADGDLDLKRFEETVARARGAAPAEATALLTEALALWRGVPFAELDMPFARTARVASGWRLGAQQCGRPYLEKCLCPPQSPHPRRTTF